MVGYTWDRRLHDVKEGYVCVRGVYDVRVGYSYDPGFGPVTQSRGQCCCHRFRPVGVHKSTEIKTPMKDLLKIS